MTSIGETLRRERLRRNLDLDQISRELKISPKLLEAIEAEQFDKLPGSVFAKSFVRQYAHMLGLDEDEMAAEVQRSMQPVEVIPRFGEVDKPTGRLAAPLIQVPKVEEWETVGDRGFSWGSPLPALALFVVAMLACSGVYAWYQKTRRPAMPQTTAATEPAPLPQQAAPVVQQQPAVEQPQPQTQPPVQPPTQSSAPPQQTPPPVQTAERQAPQPAVVGQPGEPPPGTVKVTVPSTNPVGNVRVQITADEPSWVLVRGDGKFLFSGTLDTNQTRVVEGVKVVELRLGNAGGVSIVLNGKTLGAVGPKGQVRTVQLTSGGFQIVAAPKPSPPLDLL
jgi:cytoskeleton protein RodZ